MQKVNRIRGGPTCVHESLMNDIHELVVYIPLKRECMIVDETIDKLSWN